MTNFFQQLAELGLVGTLKLTIKTDGQTQIVSLLLDNEKCGDDARKSIPPLLLKGTAAELDAGFFATISQPLKTVSGIQADMEVYLKGVENAKKQAAMNKPADKPKEDKPKEDTKKAETKKVEPPPAEKKPAISQPSIFDLAEMEEPQAKTLPPKQEEDVTDDESDTFEADKEFSTYL